MKILTITALFVGLSISAFAQDSTKNTQQEIRKEVKHRKHFRSERMSNKSPEEIAKFKTDLQDKKLNFSEDQKNKVYAFHLDKAQKRESKRKEMLAEREIRREEMKTENQEFQQLLTVEQKEIFENNIAQGKKERADKKNRRFNHRENKDMRIDRKNIKNSIEKQDVEVQKESTNG